MWWRMNEGRMNVGYWNDSEIRKKSEGAARKKKRVKGGVKSTGRGHK